MSLADQLCKASQSERELIWRKRKPDDSREMWAIPAVERYSLLPKSEQRVRCPECCEYYHLCQCKKVPLPPKPRAEDGYQIGD